MVQKASPRSPVFKDCLFAFLFGGAICALGQGLANLFMLLGFTLRDARTFVSVSLILLSAALTAFGVYDNIAKYAGAGTLVPITGFANSMVSPARNSRARIRDRPRLENVRRFRPGARFRHLRFHILRRCSVRHRAVPGIKHGAKFAGKDRSQ